MDQKGPATVRIDGGRVRSAREARGLTQLYVAEVVGVSVDTVSRWENNRTPTVRRENAEALAGALGVGLDEILAERPGPARRRDRRRVLLWAAVAAIVAGLGAWGLWRAVSPSPVVEAVRRLSPYTPPGTRVPVVLEVRVASGRGGRTIVREQLPPGWRFVASVPPPDRGPDAGGTVRWILDLSRQGRARIAYLAQAPDGPEGSAHRFRGWVVAAGARKGRPVGGEDRIDLEYVHWADTDGDFQISDAEVLDALDRLDAAKGLPFDASDLRELWGAEEYEWDPRARRFRVVR